MSDKRRQTLMNLALAGVASLALLATPGSFEKALAAQDAGPSTPAAETKADEAKPSAPNPEEVGKDPVQTGAFDKRMFMVAPTKDKNYTCFVRRYDADHLKRHPLQKVSAMKLLVSAEKDEETKNLDYSFRLGVQYRHRKGAFDSSGSCNHFIAEDGGDMRYGCGVDCDGGGINVAMKSDQSVLIRLERIRIWQNNKPDDEAGDELVAGADDRIFRLDRANINECASLVTDRKELAAMRKK